MDSILATREQHVVVERCSTRIRYDGTREYHDGHDFEHGDRFNSVAADGPDRPSPWCAAHRSSLVHW